MSNQKEVRQALVEFIYPNNVRRVLMVPSVGKDAQRVVFKDIERSQQCSTQELWKWPAETQADARSLFALSLAQSPDVRNEMIIHPEDDLYERKTMSTSQNYAEGDNVVMQLYVIVCFYPKNPFKFSPFVAAFLLQQLTWDIINYDYLIRIQYEDGERSLERYLSDNYEEIMCLEEVCDQAFQLLADIASHPFYGFQYFEVFQKNQFDTPYYLVGLGLKGFLFCQDLAQQTHPCTLPVPFLIRFEEIHELTFYTDGDSVISMVLKKGNVSKKRRIFLNFLSKERLQRFIELMEDINELNDKFPAIFSQNSESLEYIPSRTVRIVSPRKASQRSCLSSKR